jgi:hypothetical protein
LIERWSFPRWALFTYPPFVWRFIAIRRTRLGIDLALCKKCGALGLGASVLAAISCLDLEVFGARCPRILLCGREFYFLRLFVVVGRIGHCDSFDGVKLCCLGGLS